MFSDAEIKSIILAVLRGRQDSASGSTVDEGIERVLDWSSKVRTQELLLDLILSGQVVISVTRDGEIRFSGAPEIPGASAPIVHW